jgi:hypothetical protein
MRLGHVLVHDSLKSISSFLKRIIGLICAATCQARGRESMIAGFYHEGYEDPLLMLMRRRTVHAGLVVKVRSMVLFCCVI